jgi:tRNA threonylcarbamoyladenosine biosynthesis protein TsaB
MAADVILGIDTSSFNCSVAIAQGDKVISFVQTEKARNHTQVLFTTIKTVLDKACITIKDLSAIAVNIGPGSYTGLRIGLAAAKGLCYTNDLPFIAVNGLMALACDIVNENNNKSGAYLIANDNSRSGYYYAVYDEHLNSVLDVNTANSINDVIQLVKQRPVYITADSIFSNVLVTDDIFLMPPVSVTANQIAKSASVLKRTKSTDILTAQPLYISSLFLK